MWKTYVMFYYYIWLKWPFLLGFNWTSSQKGQTKKKGPSRWLWFYQIGYTNLTLNRQA
jgi:hypothetical protein